MRTQTFGILALTILGLAACSDDRLPPPRGPDFSKYVSIGTSVSMGWQSDGVFFEGQQQAWTKQFASAAGATFLLPLIESPGCQPPLMSPLGSFKRIDNSSVATASTVCAPQVAGIVLPTNNLAVENATAKEAFTATPATATKGRGPVTSRVLPAGMTQITALRASNPSFVSVEFGGNEVLPTQIGVVAPNVTYTPFDTFELYYSKIIDSVKATGAKAVLISLPSDIRQFPTIRTGAEIAAQRAALAAFGVTVNADCDASPNFVFVRGKVITAIATRAALSCADAPGTQDFILTPSDVTFINSLLAQMNAEIASHATANGYALASLESLYATSKAGVDFNVQSFMTTATPYGSKISLDGVHPSAEGHRILANAVITAVNTRYGGSIDLIN